jgi:uncharacterized protein (DUF4415 family)
MYNKTELIQYDPVKDLSSACSAPTAERNVAMKKPELLNNPMVAETAAIYTADPVDPDAPPLTDAELADFRPAAEMLPQLLGHVHADALMKRRGRPASAITKAAISLRLDPDIVAAFKAGGDGWQTRMNDALRGWAVEHGLMQAGDGPAPGQGL